jgi:hypothetical protein
MKEQLVNDKKFQISICWSIISKKLQEPFDTNIGTTESVRGISYEIICAEALIAPSIAYLEALTQPDNIITYELTDEIPKINKIEKLTSATSEKELNGIKTQYNNETLNDKIDPNKNKITWLPWASLISFDSNFKPSANGCNKPKNPV